jgi:hypothetical protein
MPQATPHVAARERGARNPSRPLQARVMCWATGRSGELCSLGESRAGARRSELGLGAVREQGSQVKATASQKSGWWRVASGRSERCAAGGCSGR